DVRAAPVASVFGTPADRPYDVLIADPPYGMPDAEIAGWLVAAIEHGWLAPDATAVIERPTRGGPFPWPAPLEATRERRYGDTTLHVARCYRRRP
ncbi:MAG: RsmD family RNA methyltransferase, partial [Pseudonocardiales bacterium]|nr:RsmD family RNA methyltransferase [Pseudonocardiales bacterium]